jgi:hypothetical protein
MCHLAKTKENGKDLCDIINPAACRDVRSGGDSEPDSNFRVAANNFALQHMKADSTAKYAAQIARRGGLLRPSSLI